MDTTEGTDAPENIISSDTKNDVRRHNKRLNLFFVYLLLIGITLPPELAFFLGPMHLTPYRAVLVCAIIPCFIRLLSGRAGRLHTVDVLLAAHCLWAGLALIHAHGLDKSWEAAGIYIVEAFGSYLIARCYIRSAADSQAVTRFIFVVVLILLPLATIESLIGFNLLRDPFHTLRGGESFVHIEGRLGLERARTSFEHPILYGVFAASSFASVFYVLARPQYIFTRVWRTMVVAAATFFSLSTGPLLALFVQGGLIAWGRLMRNVPRRWVLLAGSIAMMWTVVALLSNRDPIRVFIWYFTFSRQSAYWRLNIWEYGSDEVVRNPVFGIGFADWQRPSWMASASVDNFWLLEAMRFGLPGLVLLIAAITLVSVRLGRLKTTARDVHQCRVAYLVTITALAVAGATVHFWGAMFPFFFFVLGSGVWLMSAPKGNSGG